MNYNIWNTSQIEPYLRATAEKKTNNSENAKLLGDHLVTAIGNALKKDERAISEIRTIPQEAPSWLRQKWASAQAWHEFSIKEGSTLERDIEHVADWILSAIVSQQHWLQITDEQGRPKKLLKISTIVQAVNTADDMMKTEADRLREKFLAEGWDPDNGTETVYEFDDGSKIVRLRTAESLRFETAILGHCIGNGSYDEWLDKENGGKKHLYSLRGKNGDPRVTIDAKIHNKKAKILLQCAGKENAPPAEKYCARLLEFFEVNNIHVLGADAIHTGFISWGGKNRTIYDLPDGLIIKGDAELSLLKHPVKLPERLTVKGTLYLNGALEWQIPETTKYEELFCVWRKRGNLHNPDGASVLGFKYGHPDIPYVERYHIDGKEHRKNAAAYIKRDPKTEEVEAFFYALNGKKHRDDGPAEYELMRFDDREEAMVRRSYIEVQGYYKDGKLHRADGPAYTINDIRTGIVVREQWLLDGELHREDGPAAIDRNNITGVAELENYHINGKIHRLRSEGRAHITRSSNGRTTSARYYEDGMHITHDWDTRETLGTTEEELRSLDQVPQYASSARYFLKRGFWDMRLGEGIFYEPEMR